MDGISTFITQIYLKRSYHLPTTKSQSLSTTTLSSITLTENRKTPTLLSTLQCPPIHPKLHNASHFSTNPPIQITFSLHPFPPWRRRPRPRRTPLQTQHLIRFRAASLGRAPRDQGNEVITRESRLHHQRQDGGRGGHAPGPASQVQAPREEEEEVPGPRPLEPVQSWRPCSARKGPAHQQDQDFLGRAGS